MSKVLYELIKSLSTSEKVYFKRNTKIHAGKTSKNYLKIYTIYEKLNSYDKNALSNHFKGTTIEKYLSSEVNYLKEKILISLFNFNMNGSKRNQIQKGILLIEVLAAKGFQKEALKKLIQIKKSALKQEEFTWIIRLIELEEIVLFKEGILGYKEKLEQLHKQREQVTNTIKNLNNYHILRHEIRELQFDEHLIFNNKESFKDLENNPLLSNSENCMSKRAKEHWYYIQVLFNYLKRNFDSGLSISFDYVEFLYQNSHLFGVDKIMPVLSNYIYHSALTKNKSHFLRGLMLLEELFLEKEISQFYRKYILYTRSIEFAYYTNDNKLMEKYLVLISGLIEHEEDQFEEAQIQYFYMLIVRAAIILKKNDLGMYYCNLWFRRGILAYRKTQARLFSLMINFELKNFQLIQSEIILFKKLEKNKTREKILVNIFYTFFNSVIKHPEQKSILTDNLQKELKSISKNNKNYFDFISFDYYQWSLQLD